MMVQFMDNLEYKNAIKSASGGCRAWSKAPDSGSGLVGVRGFKSPPPHRSIDFCVYISSR